MKIGDIWIEKEYEPDESPETIKLIAYNGNDEWTITFGDISDGIFIEEEDPELNCPFVADMTGEEIYEKYVIWSEL